MKQEGREAYPSDLTEAQWKLIESIVPAPAPGPQPALHSRREIVNAILYVNRSGCQWRMLPHDLPPYRIVFHYFSQWKKDGTWKEIHDTLRSRVRQDAGRAAEASAAILDSQSVKTTEEAEERGFDAGKKVKGRKRHVVVDVLGMVLAVVVTAASVQDRDGAWPVLRELQQDHPTVTKVWVRLRWEAGRGRVGDTGHPVGGRQAAGYPEWLRSRPKALDWRAHARLVQSLSPTQQVVRAVRGDGRGDGACGYDRFDGTSISRLNAVGHSLKAITEDGHPWFATLYKPSYLENCSMAPSSAISRSLHDPMRDARCGVGERHAGRSGCKKISS